MFPPPQIIETEVFTAVPEALRMRNRRSDWADANRNGACLHSFLEGPAFDREGRLYVVDIPFGRIFRVGPDGAWEVIAEYDGWPNGLRVHRDGSLWVADRKQGILRFDPAKGVPETILGHRWTERLKGPNDLVFSTGGDLFFTDQGQTGLQDPSGRVYRLSASGRLDCLIDCVPSPNGLVLNADETVLYVGASRANAIWRVPLEPTEQPEKVSLFIQLSGGGGPDGLALDAEGGLAIAHSGLGAVWIFSPLGEPLYRLRSAAGLNTTNLAYGGPDRRAVFITESATGTILKARVPVAGRALFSHC